MIIGVRVGRADASATTSARPSRSRAACGGTIDDDECASTTAAASRPDAAGAVGRVARRVHRRRPRRRHEPRPRRRHVRDGDHVGPLAGRSTPSCASVSATRSREVFGHEPMLSCRFTHVYTDGPAPYYTWSGMGRQGSEISMWEEVKHAAAEAVLDAGGTITHHHAVGRMHRPAVRPATPRAVRRGAPRAAKARGRPRRRAEPGRADRPLIREIEGDLLRIASSGEAIGHGCNCRRRDGRARRSRRVALARARSGLSRRLPSGHVHARRRAPLARRRIRRLDLQPRDPAAARGRRPARRDRLLGAGRDRACPSERRSDDLPPADRGRHRRPALGGCAATLEAVSTDNDDVDLVVVTKQSTTGRVTTRP